MALHRRGVSATQSSVVYHEDHHGDYSSRVHCVSPPVPPYLRDEQAQVTHRPAQPTG